MTARQEWQALSEAQQFQLIIGCTARAAKRRGVKLNPVDLAGEVFVTVTDTLESGKKLLFVCLGAADAAIRREYRKERKHEAAKAFEYDEAASVIEAMPATGASVEKQVIDKLEFEAFMSAQDSTNREIIEYLASGFNGAEIAPKLDMSRQAVNKRIRKLRETLRTA